MMERLGHRMKAPSRPTVPGVIFGVAVERRLTSRPNMPHVTIGTWMSGSVVVTYRKRNGWTRPDTARFGCPDSLHEWIRERSLRGRINWVVCPLADHVLTLTKWWDYVSQRGSSWKSDRAVRPETSGRGGATVGVVFDRLVVGGTRGIIGYKDGDCRYRWCSVGNWFPDHTERPSIPDGATSARNPVGVRGPHRSGVQPTIDAERCCELLRGLSDWWRENARAPLGVTVGACAMGLVRTLATKPKLCTHSHDEAHALERAASHGGRASLWYAGAIGDGCGLTSIAFGRHECCRTPRIPGPITLVDVRSMYGSIMRTLAVPYKLISVRHNVCPAECLDLAQTHGVIARVRIRTSVAEYPQRTADGVRYPVGTFVTTLTGLELCELVKHGEILECQAISVYHQAPVLSAFARWLTEDSTRADCASRVSSRCFPKSLVVSVVGKLSERQGKWSRSPERDEPGRWGEGREVSRSKTRATRVRYLAGLAWVFDEDAFGSGPHTAAFAYIAAAGRLRMAAIRRELGSSRVVSQDTDGLWLLGSRKTVASLCERWVGLEPGQLRIEDSADNARFFSPRHYCVDGRWKLSGYAGPEPRGGGVDLWDVFSPSLWNVRTTTPPTETHMVGRKFTLSVAKGQGRLGRDGWFQPVNLLKSKTI